MEDLKVIFKGMNSILQPITQYQLGKGSALGVMGIYNFKKVSPRWNVENRANYINGYKIGRDRHFKRKKKVFKGGRELSDAYKGNAGILTAGDCALEEALHRDSIRKG